MEGRGGLLCVLVAECVCLCVKEREREEEREKPGPAFAFVVTRASHSAPAGVSALAEKEESRKMRASLSILTAPPTLCCSLSGLKVQSFIFKKCTAKILVMLRTT